MPVPLDRPDPPDGALYIVSEKALRRLEKKMDGLYRLQMGPGLKLTKADAAWRIDLDLVADGAGIPGSGQFGAKAVTICEDGDPVTYTFLVRL